MKGLSKGPEDKVPYSDDYLYAPDVQYTDGIYYLYYCLANWTNTEGVATSASPTGPFGEGRILNTGGINQIDHCVFVDDDGQAYYIWGQFTAKMARLKPDMMETGTTMAHWWNSKDNGTFFITGPLMEVIQCVKPATF